MAALAVLFVVVAAPAKAQQEPGSGLSITPLLSEKTIEPGGADKLDISIRNVTSNRITAQATIYDFESDNTTGNPKIIIDPNKSSPNSIRKFILGLEDIPLGVGEQKKTTLAIQIPEDTAPGAYYGVIRYKAVPVGQTAPQPGELSLSASVGTIVLITVPGEVREQVQLTGLHVYRGGYNGSFFIRKPERLGVEIRNLGNGFVKPFGTVEIKNMLGKVVHVYQLNNSNPRANILPSSTRIFEDFIKGINQPGRYTVTASVSYGTGGQVLTASKSFWYIPIWLAIILLAVLLILTLFAYRAYRHHKRDRKRAYRRRG